ncbi:hypothetical protein KXP69_002307 [Staphylococcus pseudintermedius]|nr:hypothetical protein [Staphylococcus pseudintermedius]MDE9937879.1 hypothetical protein [Staphylococcus pseudintermedius]
MKRDNLVNFKIPESALKLFRQMYGFSDSTYNYKIVLYAIASSLPERGRYLFSDDFGLDKHKLDDIINHRKNIASKGEEKQFKKIEERLENIEQMLQNNDSSEILTNQILLRLLLADNYSLGTDEKSLEEYMNNSDAKALLNFAKNKH